MSGSGRGGGGDPIPGNCDDLSFETQLTSPQTAVVATIVVGDVLTVLLANVQGQRVVQVLKGSQVAGGLTGPDALAMRNCMDQGHDYLAEVLNINGGQVRVRVEHA